MPIKSSAPIMSSADERPRQCVKNLCHGKGRVFIEPLLGKYAMTDEYDQYKNYGLYANMVLEPGCSIGFHMHKDDAESYYILSGTGEYRSGESEKTAEVLEIKPGDVVYCRGEGHSIENTGEENLRFIALVIRG